MIVFELVCPKHHRFEGWFASADDFGHQKGGGLLACPTCGNTAIEKLPSAKIRKLEPVEPSPAPAKKAGPPAAPVQAAQMSPAKLNELIDYVLAHTENVGSKFAEEARRIHYEEAPRRDIRGTATREQTEQLVDEGIPVMPLPIPPRDDWH
ncbi:MAG: hypothetical protein A3I01_17485 [Betaproteobacteria bacterium RIFCSPLOWO2_02_FULL_65_24]|nr:MAG: hypothetical protein A3I01_17485 [Betaproteobacteria bacterium RIFCSPLOWO2_02_FULL_65_24]